jgi:hypothetical protein
MGGTMHIQSITHNNINLALYNQLLVIPFIFVFFRDRQLNVNGILTVHFVHIVRLNLIL